MKHIDRWLANLYMSKTGHRLQWHVPDRVFDWWMDAISRHMDRQKR